MLLRIKSIREDKPGPKWLELFRNYWPSYKEWFLAEGPRARPGYMTSLKKLREYMPEIVPVYEQLVELAGGGDLEARFLSLYCPPAYLTGCSQAVWTREQPMLVRNYDYSPKLFEGILLYSHWNRPVLAMTDCLWGVLDGMNDAGLTVSLTFGGRKIAGQGFGVPLVQRYLLEFCESTTQACAALQRIPVHMPYNVSVVDAAGEFATVFLSPDRKAVVTPFAVGTNHQGEIEWQDYARLTETVRRKEFLEQRLTDPQETRPAFIHHFLQPPLYHTQYERGFGTLYTAVYQTQTRMAEYLWPKQKLRQSFAQFEEKITNILLARDSAMTKTV